MENNYTNLRNNVAIDLGLNSWDELIKVYLGQGVNIKIINDLFDFAIEETLSKILSQADCTENVECEIDGEIKVMDEYRILVEPESQITDLLN